MAKRDPFESPKRRLARAKQHVNHLEKRINTFFKKEPYARVVEKDADGVTDLHKIKFTKPLPDSCDLAATEALEALRATLDQIGYATASLAGKVDPKQTQFPIADDAAALDNVIARKRCNDLPKEIVALFRSFNRAPRKIFA